MIAINLTLGIVFCTYSGDILGRGWRANNGNRLALGFLGFMAGVYFLLAAIGAAS